MFKIGTTNFKSVAIGATSVKNIYLGTTKIFPNGFMIADSVYSAQFTCGTGVSGLHMRSDGLRGYTIHNNPDVIIQWNFSSAWDVSTASQAGTNYTLPDGDPNDIFLSSDGTKIFVPGSSFSNYMIYWATLTTAWDITSYGSWSSAQLAEPAPTGITFSSDGHNFYEIGHGLYKVQHYYLSTAWDLTTRTLTSVSGVLCYSNADVEISSDGRYLYVSDFNGAYQNVAQYEMTTPYNVSSLTYIGAFNPSSQGAGITGMQMRADGALWISSNAGKVISYTIG